MKKLVIAEKPSVARQLAHATGGGDKGDGCIEGKDWIFSWCVGHLVEPCDCEDYNERYAKWDAADLPIVPGTWKYKLLEGASKQFGILQKLMARKDVDTVVNACDAEREGEFIFRLLYEKAGCRKTLERLWLSSMEDGAIRAAMEDAAPGHEYDALYDAALCRQKADWPVGINATRLFSCALSATLSVGRVVTPTLQILETRGMRWTCSGQSRTSKCGSA